jgi:hypothetical protein
VLGVVLGTHILVIWQIASNDRNRRFGKTKEAPAMLSWFISPEQDVSPPRIKLRLEPPIPSFNAISMKAAAKSDTAISQPLETESAYAAVDWAAEASRVASDFAKRKQEQENVRSFGRNPVGIGQPPPKPAFHKRGDSQHFEGGEIIDWINDHCYYSNQNAPVAAFGQALRLQLPICKGRGGAGESLPSLEDWKKEKEDKGR